MKRDNKDGEPHITLLLTACIDPSGTNNLICHKLVDVETRLCQYIDVIQFFSEKTDLPILFVDNSGFDISEIKLLTDLKSVGRLETISYTASDEVREKGKGPYELDIIRHAIRDSELIKKSDYIIKITGRVRINDIQRLIRITQRLGSSKKRYVVGEKLFKAQWIQSYLFIAHIDFFREKYMSHLDGIVESVDNLVPFESCLYYAVLEWINDGGMWYNVPFPIQVEGVKGNGERYYPGAVKFGKIKCFINAFVCNVLNRL